MSQMKSRMWGTIDKLLTVSSTQSIASIERQSDFPLSCQGDEVSVTDMMNPDHFYNLSALICILWVGKCHHLGC